MKFEEYLDLFEDMTIEEYEQLTESQMYIIWCEYQNMK